MPPGKRKLLDEKSAIVEKKVVKEQSVVKKCLRSKTKQKVTIEDDSLESQVTTSNSRKRGKKPHMTLSKTKSSNAVNESENEQSSSNSADSGMGKQKKKRKSEEYSTSMLLKIPNSKKSKRPKLRNSEADDKLMKAQIVLSKVECKKEFCDNSENEQNSFNSTDSGVMSETNSNLKNEELSELDLKVKTEIPPCSKKGESSEVSEDCASSDSASEWEEVEDQGEQNLDDYKPDIPKEGVEIVIDCPNIVVHRRKKKEFDEIEYIRLHINRVRKDAQLNVHKTHLLCLLAHGFYLNNVLNSSDLKGMALSLIPPDLTALVAGKKMDKLNIDDAETIVSWFTKSFSFENKSVLFNNISKNLIEYFETKKALNASEYNLLFVVIARILGFKTRLCISLYPLTFKAQNLIKKSNNKKCSEPKSSKKRKEKSNIESPSCSTKTSEREQKSKISKKVNSGSKENKADCKSKIKQGKVNRPRRSAGKNYKISSDESDDENDKDFDISAVDADDVFIKQELSVSRTSASKIDGKKKNRKIVSSDSETSSPDQIIYNTERISCWVEIYLKQEKQWISIECANNVYNKPFDIEHLAPHPVTYVLAYDNDSYVKDVTRRYCNEYMTCTRKLRADPDWWEETLDPFLPPNSKVDKDEEKKMDMMLINKPLPHTVGGFKNHPLYALKRHLLKFEAIYPPDAPPVGFMRGEPVYARDCVCQLHSRETWLKEARVVRIGEEPYKIVKARPKWDKIAGVLRTDLPLELFGHWQTKQYEPPVARDGKVPRNEYGNVELFKPCMLPRGTVHLQLPGLNRIARKLGIDCCPAVVGFDGHKGSVHPVFDGFIICKEYKDTIIAAWDEEQENARKRAEEKREKRIYGNWKKLIRGLLIRERIKLKYDVK